MEVAPSSSTGTASSILGFFGNLGSAVAGVPISFITEHYGWDAFHLVIVAMVVVMLGVSCILPQKKKTEKIE